MNANSRGRRLWTLLGAALCAGCLLADDGAANAVLRLLNSRSAGSPRGYAEAAAEVAAAAKKGRPVPAFVLALMSREADMPAAARLDEKTRKEYLERFRGPIRKIALDGGNSMALYLVSLDTGDTNLLQRAADAGNIQAMNAWGSLIFSQALASGAPSNVVQTALSKAYGYFHAAASKGDANGLYNLGTCLWRGTGAAKDDDAAFNCFRAAAERGHPEAINNIGAFFRDGVTVERDVEVATKWFKKSADYDNPFGQFNYAMALRRGEGVKADPEQAAELLEKSVAGGCVEAINVLGVALWKGEGVKTDPDRAFKLFMQAAQAGYPPAMENVSTCYAQGVGVKADERQSMEWKIRSRAACGDPAAMRWLRENASRTSDGGALKKE